MATFPVLAFSRSHVVAELSCEEVMQILSVQFAVRESC